MNKARSDAEKQEKDKAIAPPCERMRRGDLYLGLSEEGCVFDGWRYIHHCGVSSPSVTTRFCAQSIMISMLR